MPIYPGALVPNSLDYIDQGRVPVVEYIERPFDHDNSEAGTINYAFAVGFAGPHTRATSPRYIQDHAGAVVSSFSGDYYNRIHINPNPLNFGSVLEDTTVEIEVWNAFFTATTWNSTTVLDGEGLYFDPASSPPPPILIAALRNYLVPITAAVAEGPGTISADVAFDMPGRVVQTFRIVGRRSRLFPFVTSWERNPKERFQWKTSILETEQWEEARYRRRQHARRSFSFGMGAVVGGASDLRVSLLSAQGAEYGLPLWMYEEKLTQPADVGETTIYVNTANSDFEPNGPAMIYESPAAFETVQVTAVHSDRLELEPARSVASFWPVGTVVLPVKVTRIDTKISLRSTSPSDVKSLVNMTEVNATPSFEAVQTPPFHFYRGYPELDKWYTPNWRQGRRQAFMRKREEVDNGIYPIQYYDLSPRFGQEQEFEWFLNGREAVSQFKALMNYMAGRLNPVWLPSWHEDFPAVQDYTTPTTSLVVGSNYASKFLQANVSKPVHFRVILNDGHQYYAGLRDARPWPAVPTWDELTLDTAWPVDIPHTTIDNISMVSLVRLLSDEVEIEWYTPQMARARTTFVYVPEQPPVL